MLVTNHATNEPTPDREAPMANIIISYDDTANDRDALALGRVLADAGGDLALAYVRHITPEDPAGEALAAREADAMLERGARSIGVPGAQRHLVVNPSTGVGLAELAEREHADVIVFGSDYRTAAGIVAPGTSAQRLLDGGPAAVAIAPAELRTRGPVSVTRIGVITEGEDTSPDQTARSLADRLGARVVNSHEDAIDLLVVGSRSAAPHGRVSLGARASRAVETARVPVLVVPRGVAVPFEVRVLSHA